MTAQDSSRSGLWKAIGPGVLFTGAAVGVSHLVQSTRAGAMFGFGLVLVIVLANAAKYPAFRFGPQYAAATHTSLLEGYRRQGKWALVVYALFTVGTMFTVQAAVTMVTAGLAIFLLGIDASPVLVSAVLFAICAGLLAAGRYRWLDLIGKVVVTILAVSTLAATALALPRVDWSQMVLWVPLEELDLTAVFFIAALVGWMPSAIDVAVWQSLWTLAREKDSGHRATMRESMTDFHVGYIGTVVLALCFLTLGAAVMHGRGVELSNTAGGFAAQVVTLYTETLGDWSRLVIGVCAFATMFSTTLTVVDGFPRALSVLVARVRAPEQPGGAEEDQRDNRRVYWASVAILALGSLAILQLLIGALKTMVDIATTLSFLTAPVLAWLNHRAVLRPEVPQAMRPRPWLVTMSWAGIAAQGAFAIYYVWILLSS